MNRAEAHGLYRSMLAVWPSAKQSHEADTVKVWVDFLGELEPRDAESAATELRLSSEWFPSVAQFHTAATDARLTRAERSREPHRELEPGEVVDPVGLRRVHEALERLRALPDAPILAKQLDAAGVKNWRARLDDAHRDDVERGTHRKFWTMAWGQIKREAGL